MHQILKLTSLSIDPLDIDRIRDREVKINEFVIRVHNWTIQHREDYE